MSPQHLVTVFCLRDLAQFRLQVESLRYLTEPVKHWVILNEPLDSVDHCRSLIEPLYRDLPHCLEIIARPCTLSQCDWDNQQYYKLWIYQLIGQDYLILDCKNFFIRTCSLANWQGLIGSGSYDHYLSEHNTFRATLAHYSSLFNLPLQSQHMSCQTPFWAESRVMDHIQLDRFAHSIPVVSPSEFLWYSHVYVSLGLQFQPARHLHRTIWPHETLDQLRLEFANPYLVFAFHPRWLAHSQHHRESANRVLAHWAFTQSV